jgi:GH24 family phage-related lysozyme (muramidase)
MTHAISPAGLALIQAFEGFRAEPTSLADGSWVVGYSHVRAGDAGQPVSQSEAADLLIMDVAPVERVVNVLVTQPLTQNQFDALVSFAFSVGLDAFAGSQVLRRVNGGDFVAAACAMDAWRKAEVDGELEVSPALVRRRATEKALFMQDVPVTAAPSVLHRALLDHAASILGAPVNSNTPRSAPVVRLVTTSSLVIDADAVAVAGFVETPVFEPAVRLTEILKSEPATEALLLTQVANDADFDDGGEIVTAHAKPVARTLDDVRAATRRAYDEQNAGNAKSGFTLFKSRDAGPAIKPDRRLRDMRRRAQAEKLMSYFSFEHVGLAALLVFGFGLIALGGSLLFGAEGGVVEVAAAAGVAVPGVLAAAMAAYGFWRTPRTA